jgi:hypothetical protein
MPIIIKKNFFKKIKFFFIILNQVVNLLIKKQKWETKYLIIWYYLIYFKIYLIQNI